MLEQIFEFLNEAVYILDTDLRLTHWSAGAELLFGYDASETLGRRCRDTFLVRCPQGGPCSLKETLRDGRSREWDAIAKHKFGRAIPVTARIGPLCDAAGRRIGLVESVAQRSLAREAPDLTAGLSNRTHVTRREATEARLRDELADFTQRGSPFTVLIVTIENLDAIRSHCGREAAEAVCRITMQTVASHLRSFDFLGRWDDDRLLAILRDTDEAGGLRAAARLHRVVEKSAVNWWGEDLTVCTIIEARVATPGITAEELVSSPTAIA